MIIVSNATCLIGLSRIGYLNLLKEMFEEIYIPNAVYEETVIQGEGKIGSKEIKNADWIKSKTIKDNTAVEFLEAELSLGEAETIALAKEINADLVILDERRATDIAIMNNIRVIGTLGILKKAKSEDRINNLIEIVDRLRKAKFWIAENLYQQILEEEKEYKDKLLARVF